MAQTVVQFDTPLVGAGGPEYLVRACGRERDDGLWEGWLEFVDSATGEVVRTVRETTQPNLTDLKYWATGLTPVYLQGALERTLRVRPQAPPAAVSPPAYDGPSPRARRERFAPDSVLNRSPYTQKIRISWRRSSPPCAHFTCGKSSGITNWSMRTRCGSRT